MTSPSQPATRAPSEEQRIPSTFTLMVSCTPAEAIERICAARGVTLVASMPRADAPRTEMIVQRRGDGLELTKAPPRVRTPVDDLTGPLQHIVARINATKAEGATEVRVAFGWRPARTGYISLWPLSILLLTLGSALGPPAIAIVLAGFVIAHWPRDVQARRLALIAKLSDALGPVLVDGERSEPYR